MVNLNIAQMISESENFISLLEECDDYVKQRDRIASCLSSGALCLAMARRDNKSVCSVEDIRADIDATLRVSEFEDALACEVSYATGDNIQLLCGMPPPSLRKSKECFQTAILEAVGLCRHILTIQAKLERIVAAKT